MICSKCSDEAFLFCDLCKVYYCNSCKCQHLGALEDDYESGNERIYEPIQTEDRDEPIKHYLSYQTILRTMPDNKIKEAIKRYKLLIQELEQEIVLRSQVLFSQKSIHRKNYEQIRKLPTRKTMHTNGKMVQVLRISLRKGILKNVIEHLQKKRS